MHHCCIVIQEVNPSLLVRNSAKCRKFLISALTWPTVTNVTERKSLISRDFRGMLTIDVDCNHQREWHRTNHPVTNIHHCYVIVVLRFPSIVLIVNNFVKSLLETTVSLYSLMLPAVFIVTNLPVSWNGQWICTIQTRPITSGRVCDLMVIKKLIRKSCINRQ